MEEEKINPTKKEILLNKLGEVNALIRRKVNSFQIIVIVYLLLILLGAFLLCMPFSSRSGEFTPFINAVFTATSATCVTGLVVYDTFTYWSGFGQAVILVLIQIGGMGFMTIMTLFSLSFRGKLSLFATTLFLESTGNKRLGGVVGLLRQIALGTVIFELLGTILLSIRFVPIFGWGEGIYNALFHSISAFCNAGFDLMGKYGEFSSLTPFVGDWLVNFTIMFLIIMGGLGFLVWSDILHCKMRWKRFTFHTKIVLSYTFVLIVVGAVLFYALEHDHSLSGLNGQETFLASLFQSVTPRTAGFNTVNLAELSSGGNFLVSILMLIGGSPGSTAGGMKTTTLAVLLISIISTVKKKNVSVFKHRLQDDASEQATAIIGMYAIAIILSTIVICAAENFGLTDITFETISAVGTVGLSVGITASLSTVSKLMLMLLMFAGRVGMVTLVMIFAKKNAVAPLARPKEKIIIG